MEAVRFFDGPDTVTRFRAVLDDAGFTLEALTDRLGPHAFAHLSGGELAPLERATRAGDALDTLLRLFVIGLPVCVHGRVAALAPVSVDAVAAAVSSRSTATTSRHGSRCDRSVAPSTGSWPTTCLRRAVARSPPTTCWASSASTMALAGATIRHPIRAAFDLGCGVWRAGAVRVVAQRTRDRVRPQPACGRVRHVDHGAEQRLERLGARRRPLRTGRARRLRADRGQSALRHLTVAPVPVPRRAGTGRRRCAGPWCGAPRPT